MRRLPAEWEPQSAVQLTFPHAGTDWAPVLPLVLPCFVKIAEAISRFEPVLIVCADSGEVKKLFSGIPPANIYFVEANSNDTWARDHGGITVEVNGGHLILDIVFNGW
ncbi:MAG TPA: agmatine deiminase, partial [Saprospirales bacterium]|nr:agmatine deiminase [Saprospirales bacterium]